MFPNVSQMFPKCLISESSHEHNCRTAVIGIVFLPEATEYGFLAGRL